jgi:hypothetical protein
MYAVIRLRGLPPPTLGKDPSSLTPEFGSKAPSSSSISCFMASDLARRPKSEVGNAERVTLRDVEH